MTVRPKLTALLAGTAVVLGGASQVLAEGITTMEGFQSMPLVYPKFMVDNLWILIAAALVFVIHLGFATLESGLTRQKNTVNILFKNIFIISVGIITYALIGFNTMYPGDFNGFLAIKGAIGFEGDVANLTSNYADYTYWSDFIFQAMFAATAATIVSAPGTTSVFCAATPTQPSSHRSRGTCLRSIIVRHSKLISVFNLSSDFSINVS